MKQLFDHGKKYLRNMSQSLFLESALFGALFIASFALFDLPLFYCGLGASLIGYAAQTRTSTPMMLKASGLIPINCFFFGIALASLYDFSPAFFFFLIGGTLCVPFVTKAFYEILSHWKLSPYIIPYIFAIWLVSLCAGESWLTPRTSPFGPEPLGIATPFLSMGRMLFLPSPLFGGLICALLFVFSPRRAIYFLIGTVVALGAASILITDSSDLSKGLLTYSAGLLGLGLSSFHERFSGKTIILFCVLSSFVTLALNQLLRQPILPLLSLPYVLTVWLAILSRTPRLSENLRRPLAPVKVAVFENVHFSKPQAPTVEESEKVA